jgi:hypothetical protein
MRSAAPAASRTLCGSMGAMQLPRFWIAMQIVIVICVLISAVIVLVKL